MEKVFSIEANGRGVTSDAICRELVDTIATAALQDGNFAISYMRYGDDPVRVGIPMKAFANISSKWDSMEGEVARYNPDKIDVSFILDATLAKGVESWAHMGRRSVLEKIVSGALVIVNTTMTPEEYLKYLPKAEVEYTLVTVDGGDIEKPSVLPLLGALAADSPVVSEEALRETLSKSHTNIEKFVEATTALNKMKVSKGAGGGPSFEPAPKLPTVSEMPIAVVIPAVPAKGRNPHFKTGSSRTYKPVFIHDQCVRCRTCWIFCPDGSVDIDDEGYPSADFDYCSGCGICVEMCPVEAIENQLELREEV